MRDHDTERKDTRKERRGERERQRERVGSLAAWQSWADLSSHTVTHRLSAIQFTFQSSHLKTERGRMRAVGGVEEREEKEMECVHRK